MTGKIRLWRITLLISLGILLSDFYFIFGLNTFEDIVYVIFYYHVSSAWISYVSFSLSLICSFAYLRKKIAKWDLYGKNCVVIGVFFSAVTLLTGSLWFNATAGTVGGNYQNIFWTWDPRQTATLVMLISYLAYLLFRNSIDDRDKRARLSALLNLVLFSMVPFSYLSAIIFQSTHVLINPVPESRGSIYWNPLTLFTLLYTLAGVTLLFTYTLKGLVQLDRLREENERLIQAQMEEK